MEVKLAFEIHCRWIKGIVIENKKKILDMFVLYDIMSFIK
jgi:hypothetical protein